MRPCRHGSWPAGGYARPTPPGLQLSRRNRPSPTPWIGESFPPARPFCILRQLADRERITANADTIGAINLLFHVGDRFQSTFDRDKGCTYEFDKQTVEGRRQINSTLRLDYPQGKSILDEKNMVTGQTKHVEMPISGCLTDLLTGVYYASSQPMEAGQVLL